MSNIRINKLPKNLLQLMPLHELIGMEKLLMLGQLWISVRLVRRTMMMTLTTGLYSMMKCLDHK
jgi:hypothetical protein